MVRKPRHWNDWPVWCGVALVLLAYGAAYVSLAQISPGSYNGMRGPIVDIAVHYPQLYWVGESYHDATAAVFWPAHEIDKRIRYDMWHIVLR